MNSSHRKILRSSAIIGSASIANVLMGILRLKGAALMVGPVGLGLIGLYLNFVTAVATLIGLGLNASGVREIAAAKAAGDTQLVDSSRRALTWISLTMALLVAGAVFVLREPIALHLLSDASLAGSLLWLAVAAALLAFSTICSIALNGFRKLRALASLQVGSALLGTVVGLAILYVWREEGLIAYVVSVQAAALAVGLVLVLRLPRPGTAVNLRQVLRQGGVMAALGLSFMISVFAAGLAVLAVRSTIGQQLGGVALGQFAASWIISSTYVGFILQAMGTDFYPRLSEAIDDRATAARLVSEQVETAVLLAAPLLVLTLAAAPWVLQLAYSEAFRPAAELLRWQIVGDLFKIASWPFAMSLLAARRGRAYVLIEVSAVVFFAAFVWLTAGQLGLAAAGIGYLVMYAFYATAVMVAAGLRLDPHAWRVCIASGLLVGMVFLASLQSESWALVAGAVALTITLAMLVRRLDHVGALPLALRRWLPATSARR